MAPLFHFQCFAPAISHIGYKEVNVSIARNVNVLDHHSKRTKICNILLTFLESFIPLGVNGNQESIGYRSKNSLKIGLLVTTKHQASFQKSKFGTCPPLKIGYFSFVMWGPWSSYALNNFYNKFAYFINLI